MSKELEKSEVKTKTKNDSKNESNIINRFSKNIFTSAISLFLIKFLGFIYRAFLFNVDGYTDEANGYYSAGYEIYALILAVIATGIPNIISRITAEKIGENKKDEAYKIFKTALKFFGFFSMGLSILLYFSADYIATKIYTIPQIALVIKVLSPAIFFVSTSAIIRGHFTGMGDVKPSASAQVIEQLLNCSLTILFAYMASGRPPHIIAAAANVSTTVSVILSFTYLAIYFNKNKKKNREVYKKVKIDSKENRKILKEILKIAIPITLASFIGVFNIFVDSVTVTRSIPKAFAGKNLSAEAVKSLSVKSLGLISKVNMIVTIPQIVSEAFANILITSVAYYTAKGDKKNRSKNIIVSLKTLFMIIFPAMIGIITLANPILHLIFPLAPDGGKLLALYAISGFLVSVNMVMNSALNGMGKVKIPPIIISISAIIKIALNLILIPMPSINIYGSPIASIISQGIICIITFSILKYYSDSKFKSLKYVLKIFLASALMGVVAYFTQGYLSKYIGGRISTLLAAFLAAVIYVLNIFILRAVSPEMIEKIPFVGKILNRKIRKK